MDAWTGNCVHVEKLNFLLSPYYAYMHQMDSTTDGASGEPVKFQYTDDGKLDSVNGRAIRLLGPNNYEYFGNYGEQFLVWDYESGGVDSTYIIGTPTDTSIKIYMRYSENHDVVETRQLTDDYQTIWFYDSVAYINGDSAFEYRRVKQFDQYYEYTKKCWAEQNRCDCELIDSTDSYPIRIFRYPLYVWFDGNVNHRPWISPSL